MVHIPKSHRSPQGASQIAADKSVIPNEPVFAFLDRENMAKITEIIIPVKTVAGVEIFSRFDNGNRSVSLDVGHKQNVALFHIFLDAQIAASAAFHIRVV